ncbi:hypothetical protein [Paenibacillus radicis (ex Xue et al. 2023)]|uniref:Flagellar hook-length control protein FliK n=1 Tax=Paenibacillus radicis (ex Xue et al. 2023) TaxID=2972489 RepID=A0ABT1YCB2_9BACL|nr:hypothetical protein [Paenibacillus radicis (ex Xue et al. 2023)]MCR8630834.1 hypothetical protein [Paenibacillus radicis (ex Xue et al. 2023)]
MNISGLIRSLIGDTQAAEPRKLELKVGEVVKGLVLQLLADQDALINIGGVQVRAKLETPLKQGEVTLLQVQPETTQSGQIVLKPLDASGVQIADTSLAEVLKNVSMQDNAPNRQIIQTLHQSGIPITKDNVQAFTQLQAQVTSQQMEDLLPSAAVAFQKGLPLTLDTVSAVRQTIAGPAFHETIQQLDSQLNKLLGEEHGLSGATRSALDTVKQVVAMIKDSSNQVLPQQTGLATEVLSSAGESETQTAKSTAVVTTSPLLTSGAGAANSMNEGSNLTGQTGSAQATLNGNNSIPKSGPSTLPQGDVTGTSASTVSSDQAEPNGQSAQASAASRLTAQTVGAAAAGLNGGQAVTTDDGLGQAPTATNTPSPLASQSVTPTAGKASSGSTAELNNNPTGNTAKGAETAVTSSGGNSQETSSNDHWLPKMMKALGIEHEHHIGKLPDRMVQGGSSNSEWGTQATPNPAATSLEDQQKSSETLKSALLQLMQADDVPPAFKESAQQAVQQITGQQLLLNSDRASMFSHITLFVPLMNANGEQTAAVHIQSRKGARGEIDAQNCRLVFDLRMKSLGDTMVDVQVVDRIVSLRVLNDQPFIHELLESNREEIAAGLSSIGYQFISIKCGPYPEKGQDLQGASAESSGNKQENPVTSHLQAVYGKKAYKGMDVRV